MSEVRWLRDRVGKASWHLVECGFPPGRPGQSRKQGRSVICLHEQIPVNHVCRMNQTYIGEKHSSEPESSCIWLICPVSWATCFFKLYVKVGTEAGKNLGPYTSPPLPGRQNVADRPWNQA